MINYAIEWKKNVNFKSISYADIDQILNGESFIQDKIDGRLGAFIYKEGKQSFIQTTTGAKITDIYVIHDYEAMLKKLNIKEAIIIGELIAQKNGMLLPFNKSESIIKTFYKDANKSLIHHWVYDVWSINKKRYSYKDSLHFLNKNIGKVGLSHVHIPNIQSIRNSKDVKSIYERSINKPGVEGVVLRELNGNNYKLKKSETIDVAIIGAGKVGLPAWNKNEISYLILSFMDKDGNFRLTSKVGTGFNSTLRKKLFEYIKKESLYEDNGEYFIKPKLVAEIKYHRAMYQDMICYKFDGKKYIEIGKKQSITVADPVFVRLRDDKEVNKFDIRLDQILIKK